jgi:HlyD family secretion protein
VSGYLRRIPFKAGATVVSNETVVAWIHPAPAAPLDPRTRALAEARRETAIANQLRARAAHEFSAKELTRAERLFAEKTISDQELDIARWRATSAEKELAAAAAEVKQAEAELAAFAVRTPTGSEAAVEIKAPVTGQILKVMEESARVVTTGTPLVEIGDPKDLEVIVEVLSRDGAVVEPGAKMELVQWGGVVPLEARVRLVEPAAFTKISALGVEEQRVYVVGDLITPYEQRSGVGDNFRVDARIVIWENEDVLKVPSGALFRRGEGWSVFVLDKGVARLRPVKAGQWSGAEAQILEGLRADEQVIMYPGSRIQENARVRPVQF